MADPQSAARIRDLEQRMAAMPGSRIFVGLAEEYRRAGRFADALATLRNGLEAHPTYLSARIAIARLFQETGRIPEAIEAFSNVLAADRENLVAAKALGDLHARQGNPVEAVKKLKLYRALSGDRAVDERIATLERETKPEAAAPAPAPPPPKPSPSSPPPTRLFDPLRDPESGISGAFSFEPDPNATLALSTLDFSAEAESSLPLAETSRPTAPAPSALPSEAPISVPDSGAGDAAPAAAPTLESAAPPEIAEAASVATAGFPDGAVSEDDRETAAPDESIVPHAPTEIPPARTLADLYARQGHAEEARDIYDRLAGGEASGQAAPEAAPAAADPATRRRRALESWLSKIKANAAAAH